MSYILDALKRADADRDRQRAAVPDLHAQSDAYPFREPAASSTPRWWLGGAALAALGVAGLAWWLLGDSNAPVAAPPPVAVAANPPLGVPADQPARQPVVVPPALVVPAPAAAPTVAPPPPLQPRPEPRRPPPAPSPAPAAVPPERMPLYAALPAALRSQMPALSVNGSVYSRTRTSRIVILNGQVFREGDRPTDGLVVEEIRLKSSVLSFRGTRFELPH